jgi:N-acetylglucosaminyldiphosphoundecaprenol N-acetyl-beta-D-mannosaminyltransferase
MWPRRVRPVAEVRSAIIPVGSRSGGQEDCLVRRSSTLVNGVRIDLVTPGGLLDALETFLACGGSHVVHFLAADPTVLARREAQYRHILNMGDLNLPDGTGVAWAAGLSGHQAKRLPGTDGMHLVARWGVKRNLSHYLFGGTSETLTRCAKTLEQRYPGIRIIRTESPPFRELSDQEMGAAASRMRAAGAEVVWVGLGTPKQDVAAERLRRLDAAPVIACVGAAFDFVAGTKRRAPAWMQDSGLEWLHRLVSEPERLWKRYLVGNPVFVAGVVRDLITGSGQKRRYPRG